MTPFERKMMLAAAACGAVLVGLAAYHAATDDCVRQECHARQDFMIVMFDGKTPSLMPVTVQDCTCLEHADAGAR